ncbi:MAG: hypothetical protein OEL80_05790 [Desulfuromonadales bacterium]|jgi:hypothetical protein|nr:hypothetical protein [Desulfuromonadales bacterium]
MTRTLSLLLLLLLLAAGCIPLPAPPHGLGAVLDEESFEKLRPGAASRADVLLALGEPRHRLDGDRFLMYEWSVAYGYVIVGGPAQAYPIPVTVPHYLCLEFADDGQLVRSSQLTGGLYAKPDQAIAHCTHPQEERP